MNCQECQYNLLNYKERLLSEETSVQIKQHLEICPTCNGFAEYLSKTLKLIEYEKKLDPRPYLYTRLKVRMEASGSPVLRKLWIARLQPAIFSMFLLLAIFTGIKVGEYFYNPVENDFISGELNRLVNEMKTEPLELFLLDFTRTAKN